MGFYRAVVRPLVFRADPEDLHHQLLRGLSWLNDHPGPTGDWLLAQLAKSYTHHSPVLECSLWGLSFANPVGLAAGFDKNGVASRIWAHLGFGFAEVGTVTQLAQPGNPRPRLFRLPADQAVLNRLGFNNQGAAALATRLASSPCTYPLGINLGKSKLTPLAEAAADYASSFQQLYDWGDYFVVNVSSPNTPGLRTLQSRVHLEPILEGLQQQNRHCKPLLIKVSPDLELEEVADLVDLARTYKLQGLIATNTTTSRQGLTTPVPGEGGISGTPLRQRSLALIRWIYKYTGGELPIIGVGGVFTADHAWEKITAGASLVQMYTGWVYEGPGVVRQILMGLEAKLKVAGLANIAAAVGRQDLGLAP